ncbi:MAG: sugar phosphate isomerase/epimerase [Chthoniobacteraceae bacterium]
MRALSRRMFLGRSAAAAGFAFCGRSLFAEEKNAAAFGLGFSLYGMKTLPLEQALGACAEIGYDNVELSLMNGFPTEPALLGSAERIRLREQLRALKLRVSALMENLSLLADEATHAKHLERIKAAGQLAHDLSSSTPPPLETVLGGKPAEWDAVKERMATQLRAWAGAAAEAKVVIAIKAHVMAAVNSPERLLWLLQQADSPWIKATYDFSHFQLAGLTLDESLTALLPQTRFIHVKDARPKPDGKFDFLLPGEGGTDYATYFKRLRELGYRGDVVVEVSAMISNKPGYDPIEAAKKSFTALAPAWKATG